MKATYSITTVNFEGYERTALVEYTSEELGQHLAVTARLVANGAVKSFRVESLAKVNLVTSSEIETAEPREFVGHKVIVNFVELEVVVVNNDGAALSNGDLISFERLRSARYVWVSCNVSFAVAELA
jgi:hypothetical protein